MFNFLLYGLVAIIIPILIGVYFYRFRQYKLDFAFPILAYIIEFGAIIYFLLPQANFDKIYFLPNITGNIVDSPDRLYLPIVWLVVSFIVSIIFYHGYLLKLDGKVNKYLKSFYIIIRIYIIICVAMFVFQTQLIFVKTPVDNTNIDYLQKQYKNFQKISINANDGTKLSGYFLPRYRAGRVPQLRPIIIYFGGNAEEVGGFFSYADKMPNYSILAFNYRGFGESSGTPGVGMISDVSPIFMYIAKIYPQTPTIIVGRSIGTGFASRLAYFMPNSKIVLITPFNNFTELASSKFIILPVWLLLRYRFDNSIFLNAHSTEFPDNKVGIFLAENDEEINPKFGTKLYDNIRFKGKEQKIIKNVGHNDIMESQEFWQEFSNYLRK